MAVPTVYEWAGGAAAFERLTEVFYRKVVQDELLAPLFKYMKAEHPHDVAVMLGEVFGGPKTYTSEHGGYKRLVGKHRGRNIQPAQRDRWVALMLESADEVGFPADPEFRSAFVAYLEFGSRRAMANSKPGVEPEPRDSLKQWGWGEATPDASFTARVATLDEWRVVTEWANREGWNVGYQDSACFHATDPDGHFIGWLGTRPIVACSMVNHSEDYTVGGQFLVDPAFRRRRYGMEVFQVALAHAGQRLISWDGMPHLTRPYARMIPGGYEAHDTLNYAGRPQRTGAAADGIVVAGQEHLDAIVEYDALSFPTRRLGFLRNWLFADGHRTLVRLVDGEVTGYGVIRPAPAGHRIGPFVASTPEDAAALFDALTESAGEVSVFVAEGDEAAAFYSARGLKRQFHVVRMYNGPVPVVREDRVFAIASLELG